MSEPFLKWAGGKRWLVNSYQGIFPLEIGHYYEPFVGSGAVFFSLRPQNATLSDLNAELIEAYTAIRDNAPEVERLLYEHHRKHSHDYYYEVRKSKPRKPETRAARFIYLNRTCWNGLYRVNLAGEFNVPIGTKQNVILDSDDFVGIAQMLQTVELRVSDFSEIIAAANDGDLIFADPPYTVRHNNNGFLKYNERIFSWDDQIRLRDALVAAANRGCQVIATNAYHPSVLELYEDDFFVCPLARSSVIAGNAAFRGLYEELLISNFPLPHIPD